MVCSTAGYRRLGKGPDQATFPAHCASWTGRSTLTLKLSLIPLGLPSLVYFFVQKRRGRKADDIRRVLGLRGAGWRYLLIAAVVGVAMPLLAWSLSSLGVIAMDFEASMSGLAGYEGLPRNLVTFLIVLLLEGVGTALGEELLFRGLIAGVLMERLGLWRGNLVQAALFGLAHLLVLFTAPRYAVFAVFFAFAAGLFMGWLRGRTDSIVPSWITHAMGFPVALFLLL